MEDDIGDDGWMNTATSKRSNLQKVLTICIFGLFLLSWSSFMFTPVTGDLKVFMASAHQAQYISNSLIIGSFKVWELKSVVSRFLMCLIYRIAKVFVLYNSYAFEIVIKSIYSLFLIFMVFVSVRLFFGRVRRKLVYSTLIVSTLIMAVHTGCHMQVEMTGSLFILLAFALYFNAIVRETHRTLKLFTAGLLIGALFYLKSVLILLSVTVVAAICIFVKEEENKLSFRRMLIVVAGSLASLIIIAVMIALINPSEFKDMIDASAFQETLLSTKTAITRTAMKFLGYHIKRLPFLPAVLLGVLCLVINLFDCFQEKKQPWGFVFFHIVMWLMPALFILLSNKYFNYHFATYLFPSIIELYCVVIHWNRGRKALLGSVSLLATVWYIVVFSIVSVNVRTYIKLDLQAYEDTKIFLNSINYQTDIDTLYLDDGKGGYALGNPSHIKYFFPLPLQRIEENSMMESHVESLKKAMAFDGKYISLYDEWFFKNNNYQELREKIEREYTYLGQYYVFCPPHKFSTSGISLQSMALYERK